MDMAAWLWERVERRDAPAVLAHALSLAPTRDALLRQAAITGQWDQLAAASAHAADNARHVGWSRSGPDAVTAICHWISADRILRAIPHADQAAPLAEAALAAWAAPGGLAQRLAASPPLNAEQATYYERALGEEASWLHTVDALEAHLSDGPDAVRELLDDDHWRATLLRHTARTGEWEELAELASDAEQHARADGEPTLRSGEVAQLSSWMAGREANVTASDTSASRVAVAAALAGDRSSGTPELAAAETSMPSASEQPRPALPGEGYGAGR